MKLWTKIRLVTTALLIATVITVALERSLLFSFSAPGFTLWFNFESGREGWETNPFSMAITDLRQSSSQVFTGTYALELLVDLRDAPNHNAGEVMVEFAPQNLAGQTLIAWVYAPQGAGGHATSANGIHLFAEDTTGKKLYGTWKNILEAGWFDISLSITDSQPACGSVDAGFNPAAIKKIGIKLGVPSGAGPQATYTGSIFVDAISLGFPKRLSSDHLYQFSDPTDQTRISHWDVNTPWGATAWDKVQVEDGALQAAAVFDINDDAARKGFLQIIYSPYLNLAHTDHHIISFDIRFAPSAVDPPPQHCPFVISLWVWDEYKQKWFRSADQQVGLGEWTTVSFDVADPSELAPGVQDYPGDMPTLTDIRNIGIQLFANISYTGTVMFANIAVGGEELPHQYASQNHGFIQTQGTQFRLNDAPFRFVGVNAEYLFTVREEEVRTILDAAQRIGATAVRTWGFSEGCENKTEGCAIYSRYFQPKRGKWNEIAFENFDRIIAMASERGLRLIVPLVNNWDEYGGIPQYVEWLAEEHPEQIVIPPGIVPGTEIYTHTLHDLFFTNEYTRQWYKEYVTQFISRTNRITGIRYIDDPTIFAWEVINEPRAKSDVSGAVIHAWLKEMSDYVRLLDPNHLIGTGTEGWYIKPQSDTRKEEVWQIFPKNYWHYGVNWWDNCGVKQEENWGSNGSDFISDHVSAAAIVQWQEYVGPKCEASIQTALRPGLPNIDYTSIHLYVAVSETNLSLAPYCSWGLDALCNSDFEQKYFQAGLWLQQHVWDSHQVIAKPFIVGEFGLRLSETHNGDSGEFPQFVPAFTPDERRKLYTKYLQTMYDQGVNGVLIWNLGHDRFNDLLWDGAESLHNWQVSQNSDLMSISLNPNPDYVAWGRYSLQATYDSAQGYGKAVVDRVNIKQSWTPDRAKIEVDLFNAGDATGATIALVTGANQTWYESVAVPLKLGWNTVVANALLPYWRCIGENCPETKVVKNLDDVRQLSIILRGYSKSGSVYLDYIRHQGHDSLVIHPTEPIFETIVSEAKQWFSSSQQIFLPISLRSSLPTPTLTSTPTPFNTPSATAISLTSTVQSTASPPTSAPPAEPTSAPPQEPTTAPPEEPTSAPP